LSTAVDTTTDIRTFRIDIADEQIDDLRRPIAATRWPSKELVEDRSQSVNTTGSVRSTAPAASSRWEYTFSSDTSTCHPGRISLRLKPLPTRAKA
jgi:hypothetical protein